MNEEEIVKKIAGCIRIKFSDDSSGHDWWHNYRVWNMTKKIGIKEKANLYVAELGALLHEVADYKLNDEKEGIIFLIKTLGSLDINQGIISQVQYIVENIGFQGGNKPKMESLEGQCVQDADRLDAMGAIGIARCFAFGGWKRNPIYGPDIPKKPNQSEEQYKQAKSPAINHFYEKLLLLKDRMNTKTGKNIAEERHNFMLQYLDKFFKEWGGEI